MKALYILNNPSNLISCLEHIHESDGLLLIEDAVIASKKAMAANCAEFIVLEDDLISRGIKATDSQWKSISYEQFVEKTLAYDKSISWL